MDQTETPRAYLDVMKWQLTLYTGWGCSWHSPPLDECKDAIGEMQQQLLADPYDVVVTTARREGSENKTGEYVRAWQPVAAAGTRIVALIDNPEVSEDTLACITRLSLGGGDRTGECGMPRGAALAHRDPLLDAARLISDGTSIGVTQYYCIKDWCPAVIGDVIVYSDTNHLTDTYMETLAPAIVDGIRQALAKPAQG